ncbi:hypothetical protein [Bythopirellula polymerisocia]|jgi:hypothetical protein|uniref:Uncharacterized protein n=1 Tax=Bythopirellula polymerisocia TaxID=2528003 RepID=A0A5C6D0L7_9BACT|nr:hypothetical protein [Bythopirellula polymerisocia]TWU30442.1 hypothetical protein Pla144_12290 [Bythopirellula polymerisocia]
MLSLLAHVTPQEMPTGLLLFVCGMLAGSLLTLAVRYARSR